MKPGDIVYFKSEYKARYGRHEYYFKPVDRYRIENIYLGFGVTTGRILNLEDFTMGL